MMLRVTENSRKSSVMLRFSGNLGTSELGRQNTLQKFIQRRTNQKCDGRVAKIDVNKWSCWIRCRVVVVVR